MLLINSGVSLPTCGALYNAVLFEGMMTIARLAICGLWLFFMRVER